MECLIIELFRNQVTCDCDCLTIKLIIYDFASLTGRESYLSVWKRCCKHLNDVFVGIVVRGDSDSDSALSLDHLDVVCIHQVAFHIQDTFQSFGQSPHLCRSLKRKDRR